MKSNALYCAIDLHGNNLFIAIVDANGKRIKETRLLCELYEVEKFLKPYRSKIQGIAVESTFNWYWLVDGLMDLGYEVHLANTAAIQQYDGIKHQNDRSDAFFLAELLRLGVLPTGYIYDRERRPLRDLFRRRMLLVSKRTSLLLSLRSLHMRMHGSPLPLASTKSISPSDVAALFEHEADQLVASVEKSHIDELNRSLRKMEKLALEAAGEVAHHGKVMSIPGIGRILSTTMVLEAGNIHRFSSAEDFASYCRMVPGRKESNNKKKGESNRKCGNRYLNWAFIEAANLVRQHDPNAKRWYERKLAKTNSIVATKALGCKLTKAVWYILAKGCDYDSEKLFGPAKAVKPTGLERASVSQRKGLRKKPCS